MCRALQGLWNTCLCKPSLIAMGPSLFERRTVKRSGHWVFPDIRYTSPERIQPSKLQHYSTKPQRRGHTSCLILSTMHKAVLLSLVGTAVAQLSASCIDITFDAATNVLSAGCEPRDHSDYVTSDLDLDDCFGYDGVNITVSAALLDSPTPSTRQ